MRVVTYLGLVGCLCALGAPEARAEGPENGDAAASYLAKGNEAFKEGRFADAEEAYREAFTKKRGYDIAGNLGAAELAQGKHREAAGHLAITIRLFPITGSPALRERMERAFARARKEVGAVRVSTSVKGARVSVDGAPAGESPLEDEVFVEPGEHVIEATLDGFTRAEQRISVEKGGAALVSLTLDPIVQERVRVVHDSPPPKPRSLTPAISLGAVAAVGVGVGLALLGVASARKSEAGETRAGILREGGGCVSRSANYDGSRCADLQSTLRAHDALQAAGAGAIIVGGAAAAAATAYLFWPERRLRAAGPKLRVTPVFGIGAGAVMVAGAF